MNFSKSLENLSGYYHIPVYLNILLQYLWNVILFRSDHRFMPCAL